MKNIWTSVSSVVLASLITCVLSSNASARQISGLGAFTPFNSSQSCVYSSWGAAINGCGSTQTMLFDLSMDATTGTKAGRLTTAGSGAAFTCYSQFVRHDATYYWAGAAQSSGTSAGQVVQLPGLGIPEYYAFFQVVCQNVPANRGVASLYYQS